MFSSTRCPEDVGGSSTIRTMPSLRVPHAHSSELLPFAWCRISRIGIHRLGPLLTVGLWAQARGNNLVFIGMLKTRLGEQPWVRAGVALVLDPYLPM